MKKLHKVTMHHVRAIRARLSLTGMSVRELARKAGVTSSVVHTILRGDQFESRHLPELLEAAGIAPNATFEQLRLEAYLVQSVRNFVFRANIDQLRCAVSALDALSQYHERQHFDIQAPEITRD